MADQLGTDGAASGDTSPAAPAAEVKKVGGINLSAPKPVAAPAQRAAAPKAPAPKVLIPSALKVPHAEHPRQRITADKLATMQGPEIRAVATDRGYDLGKDSHSLGRAAIALRFIIEQDKDKDLH
jgi:hypothetical protein